MNGRSNRWSFRTSLNTKRRLAGLNVVYVDARNTSSLCPVCGEKLSPNGYRLMKCQKCGLEEDRDVLAVKNLLKKYQIDVRALSVLPRKPFRDMRREEMKVDASSGDWHAN